MGFIISDKISHNHNYPKNVKDMKNVFPDQKDDNLKLKDGVLWKCDCVILFKWDPIDFSFATYSEIEKILDYYFKRNELREIGKSYQSCYIR